MPSYLGAAICKNGGSERRGREVRNADGPSLPAGARCSFDLHVESHFQSFCFILTLSVVERSVAGSGQCQLSCA